MSIGIDKRVQVNRIVESQLPEFVRSDFPLAVDFLKQYYISQEFQGGTTDLIDNLDQYLKVDNLIPEVVYGTTTLSSDVSISDATITVASTKGFPDTYGLLKVGSEIITYTTKTDTTFNGCLRGFSGISGFEVGISTSLDNVNREGLIFESTKAESHVNGATVTNLSVLFIQQFYKKLKKTFLPGLEDNDFTRDLDVGNFIKHARSFYQSKGIEESIRILLKVLFGEESIILDLEERLFKPSSAEFIRREVIIADRIVGDPQKLVGQTIFKSNDLGTSASVSEVEILTRNEKIYYKISLFVGYSDRDLIEGIFTIPGRTKVMEPVSVGSSIVSVDSTVGFAQTGYVLCGINSITYSSKSVNQFFGCTNISENIGIGSDLRADETIFGYEDGDLEKRVDLRITGVLSEFKTVSDISSVSEGERIFVKNVGETILNPSSGKTYKEVFANSWIYNTSSRYQISNISGSTIVLGSSIDKSSLKVGDKAEILSRNSENVEVSLVEITNIDAAGNAVIVSGISGFTPAVGLYYDLRRKLNKASSQGIEIAEGNSNIISDVLNVYTDDDKDGYVASNSLPSYTLPSSIKRTLLQITSTTDKLEGYNNLTKDYNIILSGNNDEIELITGDAVVYESSNSLVNLESGTTYYVEIVQKKPGKIRLYRSRGMIGNVVNAIRFAAEGLATTSTHTFTKETEYVKNLSANKILKKFPLSQDLYVSGKNETPVNNIGMLIDGVQIRTPISEDCIYYGPVDTVDVYNDGEGYDVVNPPRLIIDNSIGAGVTALIEPVISGTVKEVFVDPHDFDIDEVKAISLTGGNGSGCLLEPVIGQRYREMLFDSRDIFFSGGLSIEDETITFKKKHFLSNGEVIYYNSNGNPAIGIGGYGDTSNTASGRLATGAGYNVRVINTSTIQLHKTYEDAIAGINTIGISTATNAAGIHKFRTVSKKTLQSVKVLNSGSGYQYRKLHIKPTDVSVGYAKINFKGHGFSDGDLVEYTTSGTVISGLNTSNNYHILKVDDNSFRLADAGIGTPSRGTYERRDYVGLESQGEGFQTFKYPDIKVTAEVSFGSTVTGSFNFTPVVTGNIVDTYLYEKGSKYGSTILNLQKNPKIVVENGKDAIVRGSIVGGKVVDVQVLNRGSQYYSLPEVSIEAVGMTTTGVTGAGVYGTGAILKPTISEGRLTAVDVINPGIGYTDSLVTFSVKARGKNAKFEPRVRKLIIDNNKRQGNYSLNSEGGNTLNLAVHGYSSEIRTSFKDDGTSHSPIIGWAYDGNPIYGPYGYTKTDELGPAVGIVTSGYVLDSTKVLDRPSLSEFEAGYFTDDWQYTGAHTLDEHNGRFCKTDEFPNGVYAYFASVAPSTQTNDLEPSFPYFIGKTYRSPYISSNTTLTQEFDFNTSNLARNTFPYKVGNALADNDFIVESNEFLRQLTTVESVTTGEIDSLQVLDGGSGYRVGDFTDFNDDGTNGSGLRGQVKSLVGIAVSSITTDLTRYENAVFTWKSGTEVIAKYSPFFEIGDKDSVSISGLTSSIVHLTNSFTVGVSTDKIGLAQSMTANAVVTGRVDDIYVNIIPKSVSIGSSIKINDDETVRVLNIYDVGSILRVKRFGTGAAHAYGSKLDVLNREISIPVKVEKFESTNNDLVYFNPHQAVGLGTTVGGGISLDYTVGETTKEVPIPTRSIYLPNHPFVNGQKLTFTKRGTATSLIVGEESAPNNLFNIPNVTTDTFTVYAINKGQNYIGLVTERTSIGSTSEGLFFHGNGSDDFEYALESNHNQVIGDVDSITATVLTNIGLARTSTHGLNNGDTINLNVIPNSVVGVGSTAPLSLIFNSDFQKLMVNRVGFNSSGINTTTSTITLNSHGYKTGDRILYEATESADGLDNPCYYVYEQNSNQFSLGETLSDVQQQPPLLVGITSVGGEIHTVGLVNPQLRVTKNSKLSFNISDPSLTGYDLKFFYDKEFKNEFVSSQDSDRFNRSGVGTVGIGSTSAVSLAFSKTTPTQLYYGIEKGGYISTADPLVPNYSEIKFVDSVYSGEYKVFGITSDTFKVSPTKIPELLSYQADQCEILEYSTESKTVTGSIKDIKVISKGVDYKKIPKFEQILSARGSNWSNIIDYKRGTVVEFGGLTYVAITTSTNVVPTTPENWERVITSGKNANVVALSTSIARINDVRILDIGYEYPSDKTLSPEAFVSPVIRIDNVDSIKGINVVDGGNQYLSAPDVIVYDPEDDKVVDETSLIAKTPHQSISEIDIIAPIQGLQSVTHRIVTVNNSNGVGISSMTGGGSGIVTCILETPINGFVNPPFETGDEIFVEGVELFGEAGIGTQTNTNSSGIATGGDGYNSSNYQYRFFKVDDYVNSNPAVLKYSIAGLTTNPGIAKTYQSGYANIINRKNYPVFDVVQERGLLLLNESILVQSGTSFIERGLTVVESREDYIKIDGDYQLQIDDRIQGANSNVSATITGIVGNRAKFKVDYANRKDYGWLDNTGKLNEDFQVIPDNDYYQNLSYSIKSPVPWDNLVNPVNRLVHPSGLKNFSDVGITSAVTVGIGTTIQATPVIVVDLMNDKRVDTINNFDFGRDYDARPEVNPTKSKFATFQNTKLTDYTKCKSNRVLIHDDISGRFSSKGFQDVFTEIEEIDGNFTKYLVQIVNADTLDVQLSEIAVLTTTNNAFLVEKSSDYTNIKLGDFEATADAFQRKALNFLPTDKYDRDHDIKILKTEFVTNAIKNESTSIGQIDLTGVNVKVAIAQTDASDNIIGVTTTTIAQFSDTDFNGFFADVLVQDDITKELNYGEVIVDFDGTNIFYAETYVDALNVSYSASRVGVLTARYDSGTIYFECENDTKRVINASANVVGLGATLSVGVGTYRYAVPGQPIGAERSARLESTYHTGTSTPILISTIDKRIDSSIKTLVRVSSSTESAIHQAVTLQDDGVATTIQYPFTGQSNSGLGTIGAVTSGNNININFYPDASQTSLIEVQAYNEVFNTINDFSNTPDSLVVGPAEKSILLSSYDGVNGSRANKVNFELEHNDIPIYSKVFNPADTTQLDKVTGEFTIPDHFFNDNEQLTYTPGSTFVGVGSTAVSIGSTTNSAGITTDILPSTVFVKVVNENKFKLFSREEYVSSGIAITFTGIGEGNAHKLDMTKKLSKTVIGLDGIVQQPITFTSIEHTLNGAIGAATSQFVLSGISSVQPRDVLKIENEYMKVEQVGFASISDGTINDSADVALGICTLPVVRVNRGSLGIAATSHADTTATRVHRGSFNIVDSTVWFLDPPKGNTRARRNDTNLPYVRAEFSGRTFLRSNYDTNMVFDDVSDSFTGIGKTYTLTVGGANTETGVAVGNGILFINGVFQTPLTLNNAGNNYEMKADTTAGISSVIFTGISSENGTPMQSDFDINQNQLPRGGLIVSMGSTPGIGYAPLVGAKVKPSLTDNTNLFAAGSINQITGIGVSSKYQLGIQTAAYDNTTGIITVTTSSVHGYALQYPISVHLKNLEFRCPTGVVGTPTNATTYDPATGDMVVTIPNHGLYDGDAIKFDKESITFSCNYNGATGSAAEKAYPRATDPAYDKYLYISDVTTDTFKVNVLLGTTPTNTDAHTFVSATPNAVKTIGDGGYVGVTTSFFQDHERGLPIVGIISERTFEVQAGLTTIRHNYHGGGSVYEYYNDLTFGSGYRDPVSIGATDIAFVHKFVSSNTNSITDNTGTQYTPSIVDYISSTGELILTLGDNHGLTSPSTHDINGVSYNPTSGVMTITAGVLTNGHGFSNNDWIKIKDHSITLTCTMDNNGSNHTYPRPSDPISDKWVQITNATQFTFDVNVGASPEVTFTPTFAEYDPTTGLMEITIGAHTLRPGTSIKLDQESIKFTCDLDDNNAEKAYPRTTDPFFDTAINIESVTDTTITIQTLTTIPSTNISRHTFSSANPNAVKTGGNYTHTFVPGLDAAKDAIKRSTNTVTIATESLNFTCSRDKHNSVHPYPRSTDPAAGQTLGLDGVTNNTITVNVGSGGGGGTGALFSAKVATNKHKFVNSIGTHNFKGTKKWDAITVGTTKRSVSDAAYNPLTGVLELTIGSTTGLSAATSHQAESGTSYNPTTGIMTLKVTGHNFSNGDYVRLDDGAVTFKCDYGVGSAHTWVGGTSTNAVTITAGNVQKNVTNAVYDPNTGLCVMTIGSHSFTTSDTVTIGANKLSFTCTADGNVKTKTYPRTTDPAYNTAIAITAVDQSGGTITCNVGAVSGNETTAYPRVSDPISNKWVAISNVQTDTFDIQVLDTIPSTNTDTHTFVSGAAGAIKRALDTLTIEPKSLIFTCDADNHATLHAYPRTSDPAYNSPLGITAVTGTTVTVNVGAPHQQDGVSVSYGSTTASNATYDPSTGELIVISNNHGIPGASLTTPTNASYVKNTGNLTLTKANHGYSVGDKILIEDYGLTFTCTKDNNQTEHRYPRPTDYASGRWLSIYAVTTNTFKVNVNPSPSLSQFTHTFVPGKTVTNCIQKSNAKIGIVKGSLVFKCAQDAYQTVHPYPRVTDPAYNTDLPVGRVTINTMRLQVGKSPAGTGGSLDFTITNQGARYVNPEVSTPEPVYENMPIVGVSRLGVGKTEDTGRNLLLNLNVGAATTNVGVARSMFEISEFDVARSGYSFAIGDKFKPIGLVTDKRLQKPLQEFQLEVVSTFNDFFSAWQFGELDFIDDISPMQTGTRKRFPLFRNGQLLSFEIDEESLLGEQIDLNAVLVIFVNGVMQTPNVAYQFEGGTTFTFTEAPSVEDKVDVFFYKGQDGIDVEIVNINETIKIGDDIRITRNPAFTDTIDQENDRIIKDILGSDLVETTLYRGKGINETTFKPVDWTKQKEDKIIKGELISKAREIIEPQIYPTAKVIGDVSTSSGTGASGGIFVDDAESFFYEDDTNPALGTDDRYNVNITAVDALLMSSDNSVAAAITATVSAKGDISALTIVESGSGYVGSAVTLSISAPIGVGIGTTVKNEYAQVGVSTFAEATANIVNGKVDSITIDNIGLGYTHTNPPQVIIKRPLYQTEKMTSFDNVEGYTGIITGISTAQGSGGAGTKALKFFFTSHKSNANKLAVGYPLLIKDTTIGSGVTSVDGNDNSVVAIGTHFLDNIYKVHTFSQLSDFRAEITCDILSTTNTTGFAQTGYYDITNIGLTTSLGTISWGRIYNGTRSTSPISIGVTGLTVDSGLSTYPTIQRRYYGGLNSEFGLRNTGSIRIVSGL
ncbi:baseplate wedge initiator [Prochlorococcus phage P-SSM2]|uniref:Baseplate wedge initiator n=3 Tax=Salacisavirus pssm2 TaxID=2734140 RepID=Q58MP3_BPPRM|nr:baseplate wedge subunit [Prochlorococcus phage P-SSM2]AAX44489.1 baseplate wedge initiator [Prochlorococcus phage P-SSM2]ACY75990.1 predicted protein [Prochlorococcus phage P-SSM2]